MKNKLLITTLLCIGLYGALAQAQTQSSVPSCNSEEQTTKLPCAVDAEEAEFILHTLLLNNEAASKLIKNGPTKNPAFDKYRVLLVAKKERPGKGPGTYRNRSVYKVQVILQSRNHGPGPGTEPSLLTVFVNELSSSYGVQTKYESRLNELTSSEVENPGDPTIEELAVIEANDPTERMIADGFEYEYEENTNDE